MYEFLAIFVLFALAGFAYPVPEESVLLLLAYLVASGSSWKYGLLIAVLGIAFADTMMYVRGRAKYRLFKGFKQGKQFLASAGFFAVFTSRFFIVSRTVVSYMAGAMQMSKIKFHAASLLSAICAACFYVFFFSWVYRLLASTTSYAPLIWMMVIVVVTGYLIMYATRNQMQLTKTD